MTSLDGLTRGTGLLWGGDFHAGDRKHSTTFGGRATRKQNSRSVGMFLNFPKVAMDPSQAVAPSKLRIKPLAACLLLPLAIGDLACTSIASAATLQVTN